MMTELAFVVCKTLTGLVKEVVYITDSTIALSWVHNLNKRLKLYVLNRVETIRRMVEWTTGLTDDLPLYHIQGTRNLADLLTKKHCLPLEEVDCDSEWQCGQGWMTLPLEEMPLTKYSDLKLDRDSLDKVGVECYQEPFILSNHLVTGCLASKEKWLEEVYSSALEFVGSNLASYEHGEKNEEGPRTSVHISNKSHKSRKDMDKDIVVDMISKGWFRGIHTIARIKQMA